MANALLVLNDELNKVRDAVTNAARHTAREYSREAAPARHATNVAMYRDYLDKAKDFLQTMVSKVEAGAQSPIDAVLPKASNGQEVAAELEAARLMGREAPTDAYALTEFLKATEPTPGRTLALEEWQARGVIDDEAMSVALPYVYADIASAHSSVNNAHTLMNGYFKPLIKAIEAAIDDYNAVPIAVPAGGIDVYPLPDVVLGIAPSWNGHANERVWAANAGMSA
ncbi:hypothetical protein [Corynebacterium stationis]|uniref:hypothetical protein n=1 Tax=Corynebacterium stationis TaxID=1705 RepID=UPI002636ABC1|nr:hypothetical protein [Corynebacterium stationis]